MRLDGEYMIIGIKDLAKLLAITIVTCCAIFVCALFLNYNIDVAAIKDEIATPQGMVLYDAQVAGGKVVVGVSGGCLVITTVILLIFYVKNYIDSHGKELGILKALGYARISIARHFWVFGTSVLLGSFLGSIGAWAYMPTFYETQNSEGFFPELKPQFHPALTFSLLVLPALFFMLLAVLYAYCKMQTPALSLLREVRKGRFKSGKILVFFVGFSAFCFSSMTQMSMSMDDLSSETFSWMIISIGLILAFTTLLMSLSTVVKASAKTIAMMKVLGYSRKECTRFILSGYRPISYIGFALGTAYQYFLLRIMVDVVFANFDNMPEYSFDFKALLISLAAFIVSYEMINCFYAREIGRVPIKSIMLE